MAGAEGSSDEKGSHIWSLLPSFDPAQDDPREYADKVRFLRTICPAKDRAMLAPRLAMMMKGTAWAQVKTLDGALLSDPEKGIQVLLSTVAAWEESAEIQTYEKFEKALYKVTQKQDESVFSYVNRMNVAFAEIAKVTIHEVKAFIMLRQSFLGAEDKKRILSMTGGELQAKKVEDAMRQLAPKILVGSTGTENKKKIYSVNYVEEEEETPVYIADDDYQMDEDAGLQSLLDQGDEDAVLISEFEDQLIEACQDNPDLSMCFSAYTEARGRVRDKIRSRGFWPPIKGKGKTKGSKKGPWMQKGGPRKRQSLADRIANSNCRLCGARGHWRQECPNKGTGSNPNASSAEIHVSTLVGGNGSHEEQEVFERLPISLETSLPDWWPKMNEQVTIPQTENEMFLDEDQDMIESPEDRQDCLPVVASSSNFCGYSNSETRVNEEFIFAALSLSDMKHVLRRGLREQLRVKHGRREPPLEPILFVDQGVSAILDTGASKSVIGKERLEQLVSHLPREIVKKMSWQKSETVFRFGNNGTLKSLGAVFFPFGPRWLKIEVVDGTTPFLLSNAFLKSVEADICTSKQLLCMFQGKVSVPLLTSAKGLFLVDLTAILKHASDVELHRKRWEVVTHTSDEKCFVPTEVHKQQARKTVNNTQTPPADTNPAAIRAQSNSRERSAPLTPPGLCHGAQEGDPNLCSRQLGLSSEDARRQRLGPDLSGRSGADRQASRSGDTSRVGRTDPFGWKVRWPEVCRCPGHRCGLCGVHEEENGLHVSMGTEFPQLCPGDGKAWNAIDSGTHSSSGKPISDHEGKADVDRKWCGSDRLGHCRRHEGLPKLGNPNGDHIFGKWSKSGEAHEPQPGDHPEDESGHGQGDLGARSANSDADHDPAARTESPDARRRCIETPIERPSYEPSTTEETSPEMDTSLNKFLDQELANLVDKIEHQMVELAQHSTDIRTRQQAPRTHNSNERLDILEVYCYPDSQLSRIASQMGLKVLRFSNQDGDLRTPEGQAALWNIIETRQPKHIWASPDCKYWGNFSRRNMGRSVKLCKQILEGRKSERVNLSLCEEMYMYQVERGCHFHLEQPVGSDLPLQPELEQMRYGTSPTVFDMCEVGGLNWKGEPIQKRTVVLTTSRTLHNELDCRYCAKGHKHRRIGGQVKHVGRWIPLSSFAAKYSAGFARAVVKSVQKAESELPLLRQELDIQDHSEDNILVGEALKRRRLISKQTVGERTVDDLEVEERRKKHWEQRLTELFCDLDKYAPRVGSKVIEMDNPLFKRAQEMCGFRLIHAEICRGTERLRIPKPKTDLSDLDLRQTFSMGRTSGRVEQVGEVEEWQKLSQKQKIRKGIPAKLSLTLFGKADKSSSSQSLPVVAPMMLDEARSIESGNLKRTLETDDDEGQKRFRGEAGEVSEKQVVKLGSGDGTTEDMTVDEDPEIRGRPPRNLARHGPGFLSLEEEQKQWLKKVHHRLGHPDAETLVRYLKTTDAEPVLIDGAKDYQCDACTETRKGYDLPQAGAIHESLGFNQTLGMDTAVWTGSNGTQHTFSHVIDEGTLFHVARPGGGDSLAQWNFLEDYWFGWAGPPKVLYVDPAREYLSEAWLERVQEHGIDLKVSARDSHWQLGRVESHGHILKSMLTRMDAEVPIVDAETFRRALIQACHAKNTLTRKAGYSPEQAVLGCSSRLPGSVVSDEHVGNHIRVLEEEGSSFKKALDLRESARRAFVSLDNSNSLRRIMLRRSRPIRNNFEVGDLVLYWKRKGGNMRRERGQWYGPARVALVEKKVIWLVHAHRLVRASPQQLRAASLREWKAVKDTEEFRIPTREWARRLGSQDFVDLDQDDLPEPSEAETPLAEPGEDVEPPEESIVPEPEEEIAAPTRRGSLDISENAPQDGVDIPVPEDDELFGDTIYFYQDSCQDYYWEIDITPAGDDLGSFESPDAYVLAAVNERKKRSEIRLKDLSQEDQRRFAVAKDKELKAWLQHRTIRKVTQGKIPEHAIMRCRWLYVWKNPSGGEMPEDLSKEGKKAKARLIVIGWEDPELDRVVNDAPTLTKDGRMLVLQGVASHKWPLISFDISTAFLHGKGDGRPLGLVPTPEMRDALDMGEFDQVQLDGGAYGRIDAPYLWFCEFRDELIKQGCCQSPLDPCVFSYFSNEGLEGCLGIHVDDGIGGGSPKFMAMLKRVEARFKFGAFEQGEFTYTGIHFRQWDDGSIEYDQVPYIEKISPIVLGRGRKDDPEALISESERTAFRSLIGALQYAAVHSRPDLAAKIGELQGEVTRAQVKHLSLANKVLAEAKQHRVSLMVLPIDPKNVTYCAFSDASFSCIKHTTAHQGTIIFATTPELLENQKAVVAPVAWYSKKIPRVVRSTLGAEAAALSNSADRLLWIRVLWAWLLNPDCNWKEPEKLLSSENRGGLVTDCKSAYDLLTRTALPQCTEHRTTIECLLIRERLRDNAVVRWVSSQAMLADCLTKTMDSSVLRECLRNGRYVLQDEGHVLKERLTSRERLKWVKEHKPQTPSTEERKNEEAMTVEQSNANDHARDFWRRGKHGEVIRVHNVPRYQMFTPVGVEGCPVDLRGLEVFRDTILQGKTAERSYWVGTCAHKRLPFPWRGETIFYLRKKF